MKKVKVKRNLEVFMILGMWVAAVFVCLTVSLNKLSASEKETEFTGIDVYKELADESGTITMYDTANLDAETLENRNGTLIIERCIGKCADEYGNGYVLDLPDEYISYRNVENVNPGDVVLTYFIYNPDTNYVDDIMYRYDYVLDESEK